MMFDGYVNDTRVVDVWEKIVRYEITDGHAFLVTSNGSRRPVPLHVALDQIAGFKQRHSRVYKYRESNVRNGYMWIGIGLIFMSLVLTGWWWLG